ncbi:membrane-spanning 4-domains subfamily A member 4D-like isoform X2 [Choloepus didactylus]|uniref:membrane-spanning 4-domains subfamily A member 4D-like isoform X2 n=1 Tax=Choloepus didactylus TaxID=27675 RepID=UPI00189CC0A6|nr:membrane-spanning 4-domains subfamily A member 4D-like isoform X2 [Choloepus didactylus]
MDHLQRDPIILPGQSGPIAFPYNAQDSRQKFLNGEPVILGVAQIMIGLMNICLWSMLKVLFLFNVHTSIFIENLEFSYNFFLAGPIMFITSGTLSIMSAKKMTKNMIQGSLIMNTVSAVASVLVMVLIAFSEVYLIEGMQTDLIPGRPYFYPYLFSSLSAGIVTVILILFLFELIISLSLSAFGCSAVCCDHGPVVVYLPSNDHTFPRSIPDDDYEQNKLNIN